MISTSSTPTLGEFSPSVIPFQSDVIWDIRRSFDYSSGKRELLLSGSVGSAKSLLLAHLAVTHCLLYPNAHVLVCRKTMPSLKDTILQKILDHCGNDIEYEHNISRGIITFPNGSKLTSYSWSDRKYKKARSYELSAAIIEELTENEESEFYEEINARIGRLPHIPEQWIISATNPDSPAHWAYKRFIATDNPNRHVYYSKTEDNPFLPKTYIDQLKEDYDPKMARRMLYGEWLEIGRDVIYYAYDREKNYKDLIYTVNKRIPIGIAFDFNIGEGKPMSCVLFQYINDHFYFFDEIVIAGARTLDVMEEIAGRGYLDMNCSFAIYGDATGAARTTKSIHSDYDIIYKFLDNYPKRINYVKKVPRSNPPVRMRHNKVNAYCCNDLKERRLTVYSKCPTLDEGFRLTALKKGGNYIEDDSKKYQHITTAAGYAIIHIANSKSLKKITIQ